MSIKYGRPLSYTYQRVADFVDRGPYLIGIGNTLTPWVIEGSPPEVDITESEQPEVAVYIPSILVSAVIPMPAATDETIRVNNTYWLPISNESIPAAGAINVLIRMKVQHNDIPAAYFRSLGVHDELSVTPAGLEKIEDQQTLSADDVLSARLVFLANISAIEVQSNVVEFKNLVVRV